jgi:hypothetical protein
VSWKDGFNAALLKFVREDLGHPEATEVTDFRTEVQDRGLCDTCGYSVTVAQISYRVEGVKYPRTAEWDGDFAELITRLAD